MMMRAMRKLTMLSVVAGCLSSPGHAQQDRTALDTLELRDGSLLRGTYNGGTAGTIRFQTTQGLQVLARDEVLALTLAAAAPEPPTQQAPAAVEPVATPAPVPPAPVPPALVPQGPVTVPAGSLLLMRMASQVSSDQAPGRKFDGQLQADLVVSGRVVAKTGTKVYGEVTKAMKAGRLRGRSSLELALTGIQIGGQLLPIRTSNFAEAGDNAFRSTARNAAVGAVVGSAFDGSDGAKKGAAVGLGASVLRRGNSITVPPGALLEFRLTQPLTVQ